VNKHELRAKDYLLHMLEATKLGPDAGLVGMNWKPGGG
jgi:hypothetical protein